MSKDTQGVEQSALSRFIRHADADEKERVYGKVIDRATEMQLERIERRISGAVRSRANEFVKHMRAIRSESEKVKL